MLRSVFFVIRYWGGYFRPDSRLRRFCCGGFCYVEVSSVSFGRGRAVVVSRCKLCSGMAGRGGQGKLR